MSRKKVFIKNLSDTEITMLEEGWKNGKSHAFRNRCQCILMSFKGYQVQQLSNMFSVQKNTIYIWLRSWKKAGIIGILTKPGQGRKPNLCIDNKEHIKVVKKAAKNAAEKGTNMLNEVISELDLKQDISEKTLRRFLKKKAMVTRGFVEKQKKNLTP